MTITIYEYLLLKQASGEIKVLFRLGVSTSLPMYMDIYQYHLQHPQMSQFQVCLAMNVGKSTVQRAYLLLSQVVEY